MIDCLRLLVIGVVGVIFSFIFFLASLSASIFYLQQAAMLSPIACDSGSSGSSGSSINKP